MATRRAGVITVDFEARSSKLDSEVTRASGHLDRFAAAGQAAGKAISAGANASANEVKQLRGQVEQTSTALARYAMDALHAGEAMATLATSHLIATKAIAKYAAGNASSLATTDQLVNGYRILRIALSPTPLTVAAVAAGVLAEETLRLVNSRGKLIEQQAAFAAANQIPIQSVEALDTASKLSGKNVDTMRSLFLALQKQAPNEDTLKRIGVDGSFDDPATLGKIAKAFSDLADPVKKAQAANDLFGKSAAQAVQELNAAFAAGTEGVEKYGLTMDDISRTQVAQFRADLQSLKSAFTDLPGTLAAPFRGWAAEAQLEIVVVAAALEDLAKRGAHALGILAEEKLGLPSLPGMPGHADQGTIDAPNWDRTNRSITADSLIAAAWAARMRQRETLPGQRELAAESERRVAIISQQLAEDAEKRNANRNDPSLLSQGARLRLATQLDSATSVAAGATRRVKQLEAEEAAAKKAQQAEEELERIRKRNLFAGQEGMNRAAEDLYIADKSPSERAQAEARLAGDRAVAKANEEMDLRLPGSRLSQKDEATVRADAEAKAYLEREAQWRRDLQSTTQAIHERIAAQILLNNAIGKGYEATRNADVEGELMKRFGAEYRAPGETGPRSGDVDRVRGELTHQKDVEHQGEIDKSTQALSRQLLMEQAVLDVQELGLDVMDRVRMAYEANEMFRKGASAAEIHDAIQLFEIKRSTAVKSELLDLNQKLQTTQAITEAEKQGAEAVRRATLEAKYDDVRRQNKFGSGTEGVIATMRASDDAAHNQTVLHDALAAGMAYKDQLEKLEAEKAALDSIKAGEADATALAIARKQNEDAILKTLADQALAMGTVRDGLRAFFLQMQRDGTNSAKIIDQALNATVDGLSANLAKVVTHQRSSFGRMFRDVGDQMIEQSIKQAIQRGLGQLGRVTGLGKPPATVKRPTGNAGDPIHVVVDNAPGGSGAPTSPGGSGGGSFPISIPGLGGRPGRIGGSGDPGLFGGDLGGGIYSFAESNALDFGGFLADGGPVSPGEFYWVGERGPEPFVPSTSGTVIPNDRARGGGGHTYYVSIDARGTDPVLTEMRTRNAIIAAHQSAVGSSAEVVMERQRRMAQPT